MIGPVLSWLRDTVYLVGCGLCAKTNICFLFEYITACSALKRSYLSCQTGRCADRFDKSSRLFSTLKYLPCDQIRSITIGSVMCVSRLRKWLEVIFKIVCSVKYQCKVRFHVLFAIPIYRWILPELGQFNEESNMLTLRFKLLTK